MVIFLRSLVAVSGLRPLLRLRAGIGVGEIAVTGHDSPYEADGVAFSNARSALGQTDATRGVTRWTSLMTGNAEIDSTGRVILLLTDRVQQEWTVPQWEAIRWSLLRYKREWIGKHLGIAHQNVTKRLSAAGWPYFEPVLEFVEKLLAQACTPNKVQGALAPSRGERQS